MKIGQTHLGRLFITYGSFALGVVGDFFYVG
jgi:hypothetical protein